MKKLLLILSLICTTVAFGQTSTKNNTDVLAVNKEVKKPALNVSVKTNCHSVVSEYATYCSCSSCTNYTVTYMVIGEGIVLTGMTSNGSCELETTGSCAPSGNVIIINDPNMPSGTGQDYDRWLQGKVQDWLNANPPGDHELKTKAKK